MPDILKQTLYWLAPAFIVSDFGGTGPVETRAITAAEAHDALNTTYEGASVAADGAGNDGLAQLRYWGAVTTCAVDGDISYIRLVVRARALGVALFLSNATLSPVISGSSWHGGFALDTPFADITDTYLGFPPALTRWTNALINACTFGVNIDFQAVSAVYPLACQPQVSEFRVEVWGPDVVVEPPGSDIVMTQVIDSIHMTGVIPSRQEV